MPGSVVIAPVILEQAIELARRAYPNEACGLLVGRGACERLIPVTNVSPLSNEFEMDPAELISALRNLRHTGEELIAIFHSHPHGPGVPSKSDVARAYYPEAAHLIVSLADLNRPEAAAFRILDGEVLPVEVHVIV